VKEMSTPVSTQYMNTRMSFKNRVINPLSRHISEPVLQGTTIFTTER